MSEHNKKSFIDNALDVMKFDIDDSERGLIQFVPMRSFGVATNEKPLLLTVNLQSCIALIAYEKNFSFLSHMNVITHEPDFSVDKSKELIKCNKVDDLYYKIMEARDKIKDTINVGLVLGVTPVERENKSRIVIEKDLAIMFEKLRKNNISTRRLPDISTHSFILDSRTGEVIHDGVENHNKRTSIIIERNKIDEEVSR